MAIKKPTYEELEVEVNKLRKLHEINIHTNDRLENLTNSLTDIVFSVKMPERIIEWCNNSIQTLEYEPNEIIGQTTAFLYTDEKNYLNFGKKLQQSLEEGKAVFETEQLFKKKNGDTFSADVRVTCDLEDEKIVRNTCIIRDITLQKQANYHLQESEEKYRALFENAPLSYQSLDKDGRFIDINPSWLRTLGYERDEVIGKFYADFLHPDWKPHFEKNFPAFKKRGYVNDVQFKIRHKKGHYIDISFEGCIGYLPNGSFKQTYCVFQDITERKKAEDKLKIFNRVINHSLNAFDIVNQKGEFIYVNQAYADMWGYETTHEIIGMSPASHCADQNLAVHIISEIKKNGEFISEIKAKRKDGSIFDALMYARLDYDENGNEIYPTTSLDISKRKLAEEKLKENEEKFRTFVNTASDLMCITNKDGQLTDVNKAMSEILDYSIEELKEMYIPNLLTEEALKNDFNPNWGKFIEEGKITIETTFKTKYGNEIPGELKAIAIYNKVGQFIGSRAVFIDLTERKQVEGELKKQKEMFELVINSVPARIFWKDLNSVYMGCNLAFTEAVGSQTIEAVIGKNDYDLIWGAEAEKYINDDKQVISSKTPKIGYDEDYTTPDGKKVWWHSSKMPLNDNKGEIFGILATSEDITERKQAEEELKKHKENLEELVDERTKELENKNKMLEKMNKAFVGRELKMRELKQEIKNLKEER